MNFDEDSSSSSSGDELPMFDTVQGRKNNRHSSPPAAAVRHADPSVERSDDDADGVDEDSSGINADIPEWAQNLQRPGTSSLVGKYSDRQDEFTRHLNFTDDPDVEVSPQRERSSQPRSHRGGVQSFDEEGENSTHFSEHMENSVGRNRSTTSNPRRGGSGQDDVGSPNLIEDGDDGVDDIERRDGGGNGDDSEEAFPITEAAQWDSYLQSGVLVDETPFTQLYSMEEEVAQEEEGEESGDDDDDDSDEEVRPKKKAGVKTVSQIFKVFCPPLPDDAIATDFDRVRRLTERLCRSMLSSAETIANNDTLRDRVICNIEEVHCDSQTRIVVQVASHHPCVTLGDIAAFVFFFVLLCLMMPSQRILIDAEQRRNHRQQRYPKRSCHLQYRRGSLRQPDSYRCSSRLASPLCDPGRHCCVRNGDVRAHSYHRHYGGAQPRAIARGWPCARLAPWWQCSDSPHQRFAEVHDGTGLLSCPVLAPDFSFMSTHLASHIKDLLPTELDPNAEPNSFLNEMWAAFYEDPYQEAFRDDAVAVAHLIAMLVNGFPSRFGMSLTEVVDDVDSHPSPVLLTLATGGDYFAQRAAAAGFTEEFLHSAQSLIDVLVGTESLAQDDVLEHSFLISSKQIDADATGELEQQFAEFLLQIAQEASRTIEFSFFFLHSAQSLIDVLVGTESLSQDDVLEHSFLISSKQIDADATGELEQQFAEFLLQIAQEASRAIEFSKITAGSSPMNLRLFRNAIFSSNIQSSGTGRRTNSEVAHILPEGVSFVGTDTVAASCRSRC
ncbi:Hypothetical protein, putative [Bodo saltans]|uniref:Uncharacterized protein n=1 Tax=Bodo saltans TaxID=75058 RepID=A0A0S4ITI5_BODSA|nr:Hypothetical protein, putative [Bodo saltans]|eukprot:CUF74097.1 Hypothetical protein, putative [Bodo saltans]